MQCFVFVFLQKINFEIYSWLILLFPRSELLFWLQSTTKNCDRMAKYEVN